MTTSTSEQETQEQWDLTNYLICEVTGRASGARVAECHLNLPQNTYFIGNLKPKPESEEGTFSQREFQSKLAPSAFGAEFLINTKSLPQAIEVELSWACYYRAIPTWEQQMKWLKREIPEPPQRSTITVPNDLEVSSESIPLTEEDAFEPPRQYDNNSANEQLFFRFKKHRCCAKGTLHLLNDENGKLILSTTDLKEVIDAEIARAIKEIKEDPEALRLDNAGQVFTVPESALQSEQAFKRFMNSKTVFPDFLWAWEITEKFYVYESSLDKAVLLIQFLNATPEPRNRRAVEPFFFEATAKFGFKKDVMHPFTLELAPENFRYDRKLWGRGFNCGLDTLDNTSQNFITTHIPQFDQMRYQSQDKPQARFDDLEANPILVLKEILTKMEQYVGAWDTQETNYATLLGIEWDKHKPEYETDKRQFLNEIERFRLGLSLIEKDPDIFLAFQLANRVFNEAGKNTPKVSWRLFQIVFIVTQIPGIAALKPEHAEYMPDREMVDIIYFPTGGGKTEAYLGTLVFHAFFDRLRGKKAGVTAWIRFPLRLLTLQQTQRMADVFGIAELIRRNHADKRLNSSGISRFAVGYYVGTDATPNKLHPPKGSMSDPDWSTAIDPVARQKWKRIISCPSCKTPTVRIEFDPDLVKVIHKCNNANCAFEDGILPVYVIDNEIYRYLPTVMVGTIDKLAFLGIERKLSMVFGKVDGVCRKHGFFNDKCCQKDCDNTELKRAVPEGLSGPTLFLQDELHLLKEGLGTFDSHYETYAQFLLRECGAIAPLKIIASSATIEKYGRQVQHLYGKKPDQARRFPGPGPTAETSFYAETLKHPQRLFVGIIPHNKTLFNAMLEMIEYYHTVLHELVVLPRGTANPYGGQYLVGSDEWNKLLDLYYSSLTYFLATRDLDSFKTDLQNHVNNNIFRSNGIPPVNIKELTGQTTSDEVASTLDLLGKVHTPSDGKEAVLATSMVSHGVDIDRLNAMFFYGMPRQNAEYIQASSRVGRKHIGIVFNCFHPIRERDQSHYGYYQKYHEFLGQLVEPAAINRWATYGIDKTLPGLFNGMLLQLFSNRQAEGRGKFYIPEAVKRLFADQVLTREEFIELLKRAYKADPLEDERNQLFVDRIEYSVRFYVGRIHAASATAKFVSETLRPHRPMNSLRNMDQPIEIHLDRKGEEWADKLK